MSELIATKDYRCVGLWLKTYRRQENTEIVPWLNDWNILKYFKYLYSTRLVGLGEGPLLWESENISCVQAQHVLDTVTSFHCDLLSITSLCFFLRSPWSEFIITTFFSHDTVTDAVISQMLVPSIHPSTHLQKNNKGWQSVAPFQVSAQILKLIILKVHTENAGLPSVQCEREVPPLTTYWFYLCDLTVPPSQPANIPGGKAKPTAHRKHTATRAHTHTRTVW